jgi:hypothetical protein
MSENPRFSIDRPARAVHRVGQAGESGGVAGNDAGGAGHGLSSASASITRSLQGLQDTLVLLVAALPVDDPMVPRLHVAAENMTCLARAVLNYVAVHDPHAGWEL